MACHRRRGFFFAVSSEAFSFLVYVLLFFVDDDLSLSSVLFFLRLGDSCVCVRVELRHGGGVLFLPIYHCSFYDITRRRQYLDKYIL